MGAQRMKGKPNKRTKGKHQITHHVTEKFVSPFNLHKGGGNNWKSQSY